MSLKIISLSVCGLEGKPFVDEQYPTFSWKLASDENAVSQKSYRAVLKSCDGVVWDTGECLSDEQSVRYSQAPLMPKTEYTLELFVTSDRGATAAKTAHFETTLLCDDFTAWDGAEFIGSPEYYVCREALGIFSLETNLKIESGCAGVVFGADDYRLLNRELNEMLIEGENYISVCINKSNDNLEVYRVGYAEGDSKDVPLCVAEIPSGTDYALKIDCTGNCIDVYINGEKIINRLQLNPLGDNDVTTFPHLGNIGYIAKSNTKALFDRLDCKYIRHPSNTFYTLKGESFDTAFETLVKYNPDCHALPMLRREFSADNAVKKARLYVTSRGIYECRINGKTVSNEYFAPGASQFDKHLYYQTYDVTDLLNEGENAIGFTLSSGWWSGSQTFVLGCFNLWGDKESVMARLDICYADGTNKTIVTDTDNWHYYGEGAYKFAGFFQGERLDGRQMPEYDSFFKVGFSSDKLKKPSKIEADYIPEYDSLPGFFRKYPEMNRTAPKLCGRTNCPITNVKELQAISVTSPAAGVYIYDLGQEIAGVVKIKFNGTKGEEAIIRYSEMLYPDLPEYGELSGRILVANLRDAASTDKYILAGGKNDIYSPKFTFHGFRYIEISGVANPPDVSDVIGVQLSSVKEISANIKTDNPLLNRFVTNVEYSQLCNFISIPTDCPQRNERMGWAGDTHVFCKTANINSDAKAFYLRYLEALRDCQEENGNLPEIAPVGGGFGGITYGCAMAFIANDLYDFYADKKIIFDNYAAMKKYMDYLFGIGMPRYGYVGPIDDWLAPEPTDSKLVWTAFFGRLCAIMSRFADICGYDGDKTFFDEKYADAKEYFNITFFDSQNGVTLSSESQPNDSVGSYAIPLAYDMFNADNRIMAQKRLAEKVRSSDYKITTGFFGTGLVNPMLSQAGYSIDAYKMMTQSDYPSWLYPVTQGATTVWERWNSYTHERGFGGMNAMNSFNHYSLGSVLSWLYEYALGIRQENGSVGYKKILIKPDFSGFESISGSFETPYGRVGCSYKISNGSILLDCEIPIGTTARVVLPDREEYIGSGSYTFASEVTK